MNSMGELKTLVAGHKESNLELKTKFSMLVMFSTAGRFCVVCRERKTSIISQSTGLSVFSISLQVRGRN